MKLRTLALIAAATLLPVFLPGLPATVAAQEKRIVLRTSVALDGRGRVLKKATIAIEGEQIVAVELERSDSKPPAETPGTTTYDLRNLTVLPGWIDAHVHITYHFGPNGRAQDKEETPQQAALAAAGNAYATLLAGFTTVQSVGSDEDKAVRDAIERGVIPGPRLLTSLEPIFESTGTPDEIRKAVRKLAANGANLVKIFASKSIREGGAQSLTQEQLDAACGEAKSLGLRTLVHAHSSASIRAAVKAGCTQIEHGVFATDDDLRLMADRGVYFDPQAGLIFHNYFDNRAKFLGIENYSEAGFAAMEKAVPLAIDVVHRATTTKNLKLVFGTDAVAGAHGRNAEEFIYRVRDAGQHSMDAMVSAHSRAAQAMNLLERIGAIAPGLDADIIALDGNPLEDITSVRRVVFVMKGGKVYKNLAPGAPAGSSR
jgi:imidazolonepropionase-like amidohydrolase